MIDIHSREVRSFNMSRVRGKNTKPEMLVRKFMFANGLRYILHDKRLPGKPDLVFPKLKTVIFVNGCFWHGHKSCKYFSIPKTRSEWWTSKIESNIARDSVNLSALEQAGWKVLTIWECQLRVQHRDIFLNNLLREMNTR